MRVIFQPSWLSGALAVSFWGFQVSRNIGAYWGWIRRNYPPSLPNCCKCCYGLGWLSLTWGAVCETQVRILGPSNDVAPSSTCFFGLKHSKPKSPQPNGQIRWWQLLNKSKWATFKTLSWHDGILMVYPSLKLTASESPWKGCWFILTAGLLLGWLIISFDEDNPPNKEKFHLSLNEVLVLGVPPLCKMSASQFWESCGEIKQ